MAAPNAPSNLVARALTGSRIDLSWTDNSNDETEFELERSPNGTSGWTQIATPAANATTYSNTGLTENTLYTYRIRAVNGDGNSAYSNVANARTLLPGKAALTPRLYILQPEVVFAAQVNIGSVSYPIDAIPYDSVTTGAYTDVQANMTVLLGTAPGLNDLGEQRVRKAPTSSLLYVGRSSKGKRPGELMVVNNTYITVLWEYLPWAKMPYISPLGEIFKDSDVPVGNYTTFTPPVAVAQASFAATIDPDTGVITVLLNGQLSYATADGATIVSYAWNIHDGTLLAGTLTDDNITVTFPPGYRYIDLTVVDSNDVPHTTHRLIYARDPDNDDSIPIEIEQHTVSDAGQRMTVRPLINIPRDQYRENAPCLIWEREPNGTADRDHMLMVGYLHDEAQRVESSRVGNLKQASLQILDIAGKLDTLPGLPQSLANDTTRDTEVIPDITWSYMVNPTLDKYLHYLLLWHSTALEIADFTWSGTEDLYQFLLLTSDGESLWQQVDRRARAFLPDYVLTCDRRGRIAIVPDPMLRDPEERTDVILAGIDESDYSEIEFTVQRWPRVHWLRGSAIVAGDTQPIGTVFSIAPGDTPGQGVGEMAQGEQLALDQGSLNAVTGHRYARANAPYSFVRLTMVQDDGEPGTVVPWREIEPAYKQWVTLNMGEEVSPYRGVVFDNERALPREITIRYERTRFGLQRTVQLVLELETVGEPGVTVVKPEIPPVGELPEPVEPEPLVPDFGLRQGQEGIAAICEDGYLYRTSDFQTLDSAGGPTWERMSLGISEAIYSFVVDPFSPGYINGSGAVNGYIATETDIYRIEDFFGTPAVAGIHTFDTPALFTNGCFRCISASFGRYFENDADNPWLLCLTDYVDTTGHEREWATFSVDAGATWSEEVRTSDNTSTLEGSNVQSNDIDAYLSPKTPGLAFVISYSSNLLTAESYVSEDWGATWAKLDDPDLNFGRYTGGAIHVPWPDNEDEGLVYHPWANVVASTGQFRLKRVNGTTIEDISPSDGTRSYGSEGRIFGVRTFDSNRQYVVLAGIGNDTTTSRASDRHACFVSSDYGDSWTMITASVSGTETSQSFPVYAAFAGDTHEAIFLWGSRGYIRYTNDFGANVDNKSGNLAALNGGTLPNGKFIGIAGGPTG